MPLDGLPRLADPAPASFPERRSALRAIIWSCEEFCAAHDALAEALHAGDAPRGPAPRPRPGETELWRVAGLTEEFRGLVRWFDTRYRAHPPPVALLHLDRFVQIWRFVDLHRERLRRAGLISTHRTDGTRFDAGLLTALVSVDYTPGFLRPPEEAGIGSYEGVVALSRAIASGQIGVVEFVRHVPDTHGGPEDETDAFELDEFEDALETWYALRARPLADVRAEAERFWSRVRSDEEHPLEGSHVLAGLLLWFGEHVGEPRRVGVLFRRFLVMTEFIEQHSDRLAELGFLEAEEKRLFLTGSLFTTLNNLPLTPSRHGGALPFDFEEVVATARAHRERLGDGVIVRRSGSDRSPWRLETAVGRNDPCPCGSRRRFKRCCGPRLN